MYRTRPFCMKNDCCAYFSIQYCTVQWTLTNNVHLVMRTREIDTRSDATTVWTDGMAPIPINRFELCILHACSSVVPVMAVVSHLPSSRRSTSVVPSDHPSIASSTYRRAARLPMEINLERFRFPQGFPLNLFFKFMLTVSTGLSSSFIFMACVLASKRPVFWRGIPVHRSLLLHKRLAELIERSIEFH